MVLRGYGRNGYKDLAIYVTGTDRSSLRIGLGSARAALRESRALLNQRLPLVLTRDRSIVVVTSITGREYLVGLRMSRTIFTRDRISLTVNTNYLSGELYQLFSGDLFLRDKMLQLTRVVPYFRKVTCLLVGYVDSGTNILRVGLGIRKGHVTITITNSVPHGTIVLLTIRNCSYIFSSMSKLTCGPLRRTRNIRNELFSITIDGRARTTIRRQIKRTLLFRGITRNPVKMTIDVITSFQRDTTRLGHVLVNIIRKTIKGV